MFMTIAVENQYKDSLASHLGASESFLKYFFKYYISLEARILKFGFYSIHSVQFSKLKNRYIIKSLDVELPHTPLYSEKREN